MCQGEGCSEGFGAGKGEEADWNRGGGGLTWRLPWGPPLPSLPPGAGATGLSPSSGTNFFTRLPAKLSVVPASTELLAMTAPGAPGASRIGDERRSGLAGPRGGQAGAWGRQQAHPDPLRRSPSASPGVLAGDPLFTRTAG